MRITTTQRQIDAQVKASSEMRALRHAALAFAATRNGYTERRLRTAALHLAMFRSQLTLDQDARATEFT